MGRGERVTVCGSVYTRNGKGRGEGSDRGMWMMGVWEDNGRWWKLKEGVGGRERQPITAPFPSFFPLPFQRFLVLKCQGLFFFFLLC